MVENGPDAIDIGGGADPAGFAGSLFGRHETGRSQDLAGYGEAEIATGTFGQAEIGDPWPVLLVDQDIRRLQVAVQDALLVGVINRLGDDLGVTRRPLRWHRTIAHDIRQVPSLNQLHGEIVLPVLFAGFMDGDDIGMVEIGRRLGFTPEAQDLLFAGELP